MLDLLILYTHCVSCLLAVIQIKELIGDCLLRKCNLWSDLSCLILEAKHAQAKIVSSADITRNMVHRRRRTTVRQGTCSSLSDIIGLQLPSTLTRLGWELPSNSV